MHLTIDHTTTYRYDGPVNYGVQRLRLSPQSNLTQRVLSWDISIDGGTTQVDFVDHHGNHCRLVRLDNNAESVSITARGQVETLSDTGIVGTDRGLVPLWLYRRPTPLTGAGAMVKALAADLIESSGVDVDADAVDVSLLHSLGALVAERVSYMTGSTQATDTAEDALAKGQGVCQDHAHVFIAAARHLKIPARYVSGYLMMTDRVEQDASHGWAEAWIDPIGWVGFDPSNAISPDMRYVRTATGLDYVDAAPISGVRFGSLGESLHVSVNVEQ